MQDYYLVLGISQTSDIHKIKKAYRSIAKISHPDVSQTNQNAERFNEIKEAYETLSDETNRQAYDDKLKKENSVFRISGKMSLK